MNEHEQETDQLNSETESMFEGFDNADAMSDEEFSSMFDKLDSTSGETGTAPDGTDQPDAETPATQKPGEADLAPENDETEQQQNETAVTDGESENPASNESDVSNTDEPEEKETGPESSEVTQDLDRILKPFRANGKDIKVDSVDEAIQLMQQGANYAKKMTALKPNLKILKMLENNGVLSEEKLSYLIDLDKKNPDAIAKLVQDSGIDPLDISHNATEYKPKTYTVDDREMALDSVLEDIQDSPTYGQTVDVVSNKWDDASKRVLVENPQVIKAIDDQMQNGIYQLITSTMEKERMLGRLGGLSDLDAYRHVGDALYQQGAFNQLAQKQQQTTTPNQRNNDEPAKRQAKKQVNQQKRAASSTRAKPQKQAPVTDFNPLAVSDEEFEKLAAAYNHM